MRFLLTRASWYTVIENEGTPNEIYLDGEDDIPNYIEINTLEELLTLKEKHGNLIISESFELKELQINIYDDFME